MTSYYGEYLERQRWKGMGKKIVYYYNEFNESNDIFLFEYQYLNGERFDSEMKMIRNL